MNKVTEIMRRELSQSGCLFGYQAMWHTLDIKYGKLSLEILCKYNMIKYELDAQRSQDSKHHHLKRRVYNIPGPNDSWHEDGYDKIISMDYHSMEQQMGIAIVDYGLKMDGQTMTLQ